MVILTLIPYFAAQIEKTDKVSRIEILAISKASGVI